VFEMRITFGMQLDGQRPTLPSNQLGTVTLGPLGLLDILETHLGLIAIQPYAAQRTAAYRDCLAHADHSQRFYHTSFAADELGVAAEVLSWRDELYLHGWRGEVGADASVRLKDLAQVECRAREHVAPSIGERLQRVAIALQTRRPPIKQLILTDAWHTYPVTWQAVIEQLPHSPFEWPKGNATGFLGQLQLQLQKSIAGEHVTPIPWQDDGTVRIVQAQTRSLAASWLSRSLPDSGSTLLVSSQAGDCLDGHMAGTGRARHGLGSASVLRPALQVLPLVLRLLWAPLDYPALVQFLTHPICPIRAFARRQLAGKIASAPGLQGALWERELATIAEHYGDDAPQVLESIATWLQAPTFSKEHGAPLQDVLEKVRRLCTFFEQRMGHEDAVELLATRAGYVQCATLAQTLETLAAQGVQSLRPRQLQQVLEQASANGTDNPLLVAQVGAQMSISRPGAAIAAADTVAWWNLTMPALSGQATWSNAELKQLEHAGVALPAGATLLTQAAQDWLRPVLAANHHLILVLAPPREESHPLWQMIEALVQQPEVKALETLLYTPGPLCQPQTVTPLPLRKRWWKLPADTPLPVSGQASFSSLNLLLFNPYQWLLHYGARIRPSKGLNLGDGYQLKGALAHRLAEQLFAMPEALSMSPTAFSAWFSSHFDPLIQAEGAVLLMDGRGADLATFRLRVRRALEQLRTHFTAASVQSVIPEMTLAGQFAGGALAGSADLVITKADGHQAIVDMKWAGGAKYPGQLRDNRHLQLAIYAELLRQATGSMPSVGYYLLDSARLLTPDDRAFPTAECIPAKPAGTTRELWQCFIEAWKWRQQQVNDGVFEVALAGIEADEQSLPPANALSMEYLKETYNDYLALAGWEQ